ncbi:hypothetical protein TRVA0_052S00936 [Trichomonascus vanleenenianus]|uniref:uncharacterized protein n=1 Tax=Trichomonascus vanleenenianus TaxID=2268995 RepID=UPI003ECA4B7A
MASRDCPESGNKRRKTEGTIHSFFTAYPCPAVYCPICSTEITHLTENQRYRHANQCLGEETEDEVEVEEIKIEQKTVETVELDTVVDIKSETDDDINHVTGDDIAVELEAGDETVEFETDDRIAGEDKIAGGADDSIAVGDDLFVDDGVEFEAESCEGEETYIILAESTSVKESDEISTTSSSSSKDKKGKKPPKSRPYPFYKVIEIGNTKIAVDAFCYGPIQSVTSFFLTHFHSDHYGGLCKSWKHGIIYCTPATANLLQMHLNVDYNIIRTIPLNEWVVIEGIEVLFLDANHCPGSAIILFRAPDKTVLHTGDFRASVTHHVEPLRALLKKQPIDTVYLDTTYLDPTYMFPSQQSVIESCAAYVERFAQGKLGTLKTIDRFFQALGSSTATTISSTSSTSSVKPLILVGTYTIGKERLAVSIAEALGSKIFARERKMETLQALEDAHLSTLLSNFGVECAVHLVGMRDLTWQGINDYFGPLQKKYTHCLAFIPTGWNFRGSKSHAHTFTIKELELCRQMRGKVQLFKVPYSEHSSFSELEAFCTQLPIRRVIPTVNTGTISSRRKMSYYLDQWIGGS